MCRDLLGVHTLVIPEMYIQSDDSPSREQASYGRTSGKARPLSLFKNALALVFFGVDEVRSAGSLTGYNKICW